MRSPELTKTRLSQPPEVLNAIHMVMILSKFILTMRYPMVLFITHIN